MSSKVAHAARSTSGRPAQRCLPPGLHNLGDGLVHEHRSDLTFARLAQEGLVTCVPVAKSARNGIIDFQASPTSLRVKEVDGEASIQGQLRLPRPTTRSVTAMRNAKTQNKPAADYRSLLSSVGVAHSPTEHVGQWDHVLTTKSPSQATINISQTVVSRYQYSTPTSNRSPNQLENPIHIRGHEASGAATIPTFSHFAMSRVVDNCLPRRGHPMVSCQFGEFNIYAWHEVRDINGALRSGFDVPLGYQWCVRQYNQDMSK